MPRPVYCSRYARCSANCGVPRYLSNPCRQGLVEFKSPRFDRTEWIACVYVMVSESVSFWDPYESELSVCLGVEKGGGKVKDPASEPIERERGRERLQRGRRE